MEFSKERPATVTCYQAGQEAFSKPGVLRIRADLFGNSQWVLVLGDEDDDGAQRAEVLFFGGDTICRAVPDNDPTSGREE